MAGGFRTIGVLVEQAAAGGEIQQNSASHQRERTVRESSSE